MKDVLISILRDKQSSLKQYREAAFKLGNILAYEASQLLEKDNIVIETPLAKSEGKKISHNIVLVPVLRAGLALLNPFLSNFEHARIGLIGLRRDEKTIIPHVYYKNLPSIKPSDEVIILEPMLATGRSALTALALIQEAGALPEKMILVSVIAAPEGYRRIQESFPAIKIIVVQQDDKLNDQHYILPGLGDFGDRYFGND